MALAESQEVALRINAETSGQSDVSALVDRIEALAREGGEAAPQLAAITSEVRKLGQQKVSIDGLQEAEAGAKQAAAAFIRARANARDLDQALAEAKGTNAGKEAIRQLEAEIRKAGHAVAAAEKGWKKHDAALKTSRSEAAGMGVDVRNLGEAQRTMAASFDAVASKVDAQAAAMQRARQIEQERAAAARQQAQEEDRLAAIVAASKARLAQAAQEQLAAEKSAYAESQAAAKRYAEQTRALAAGVQNAFNTIGIRSSQTIQAEILVIQQSLQRLANEAKVTGADFDRAWAAGQKRIAALKTEAAGGVDPLTASVSRATQAGGLLNTKMREVATTVGGLFAVSRLPGLAADLGRTADLYADLGARLNLVNSSQAGFNVTLTETAELARNTHTGLESTTSLLAALARAGKEVGLTQDGTLRLTKTISQANQIAGQSAASADAAIVQLIQGLQSGVLRGEEFNSVMEQSPRIAQALADGLGVSLGALREMSLQGKLTSGVVIHALQSQAQAIDAEFGRLPLTIGRVMTDLGTNWTQFLGELDKTHGVSATAAQALQGVANNLDTIASLAAVAGNVALAAFATKLIPQVAKFGQQALEATQKVGGLRAGLAALPATVKIGLAVVGYEVLKATGQLIGETAAKWSGAGEQMRRAEESMRASSRTMLDFGQDLAYNSEQYRNTVMLTAAEVARLSEAERVAYLERLTGAKEYFTGARFAAQAAKELGIVSEFSADQASAGLARAREALAAFESGASMSAAEIENLLSVDASLLIEQFDKLAAKGKDSAAALREIASGFDAGALDSVKGFGQALIELQSAGKASADEVGAAWQDALAKLDGAQLNAFTIAAQAAFGQSERDVAALAAAMDGALRASIAATGQDFSRLTTGISTASASALGHLDLLVAGFDDLQARGVDTAATLAGAVDFAAQAADSTKALTVLRAEVERLGREGKLSGEQVAAALGKIDDKVDDLTPGINSLAEALKDLGIQSDADLKKVADGFRKSYEAVVQMGGSMREQRAAFEKYAEAAIRANGGAADAILAARARQHGLTVEVDETGKAFIRAGDDAEAALEKMGKAAEDAADKVASIKREASGLKDVWDADGNLIPAESERTPGGRGKEGGITSYTERGAYERARSEGLDDATALRLAREFANSNRLREFEEAIDAAILDAARAAASAARFSETATSRAVPRESTTVYRVEIGTGAGRKTAINAADQGSADALVNLLQQLEADMARS